MTSTIPTVNLTPFTAPSTHSDADRILAGKTFIAALHRYGFTKVSGHGLSHDEVDAAFEWNQNLFDLPHNEKMKAPHPPGPFPHRGYSGKVPEGELKESYEVGSEEDDQQQNIWLPEEVLPGFRAYATSLYERLARVSEVLLSAMGIGLGLDDEEQEALMQLASKRHSQLRFMHYPAVSRARLQSGDEVPRLAAHNDWGTFTILFQDQTGGLELRDPQTGDFIPADPEDGTLVLNIGDMLGRFTNDYFKSAEHRVQAPDLTAADEGGIPGRRTIPFFIGPVPSHTVATLERFVDTENPARYEPVRFDEYGAIVSEYHYQAGNIG
ncbi:hypothetical protein B0T14DRAFT_467157 [Immersiella caudata]|uniref:Fe2OG dioxygenase domain-containing protein n=1 Tax=Immersiella caudata TaxID=314043 RepID=A0AA39XH68_9PEZI|nr:hypothetical protein B0T14DRAFT_467157 [Immersiella caudata]